MREIYVTFILKNRKPEEVLTQILAVNNADRVYSAYRRHTAQRVTTKELYDYGKLNMTVR